VGRVVGQIFAYLYFSEPPRTLDDMKEALGISKGSASMGVRQLEQWGAVQRIWVKGDRKDYYTANDYFGQIVKNIVFDIMGKRLGALSASLDAAEGELFSCSVAKLLSERPEVSSSSTTQPCVAQEYCAMQGRQPNNLTTTRASGATKQRNNSTTEFLRTRVRRLRDFQNKVEKTWNNPIIKMVLK